MVKERVGRHCMVQELVEIAQKNPAGYHPLVTSELLQCSKARESGHGSIHTRGSGEEFESGFLFVSPAPSFLNITYGVLALSTQCSDLDKSVHDCRKDTRDGAI